jgi:hypothetical protein
MSEELQPIQSLADFERELGENNYDAGHLWHLYAVRLWGRINGLEELVALTAKGFGTVERGVAK